LSRRRHRNTRKSQKANRHSHGHLPGWNLGPSTQKGRHTFPRKPA
jgi:hypothetical protein